MLFGNNIADMQSNVASVDCDALANSNILSNLILFHEKDWYGFKSTPDNHNAKKSFIFKYRVISDVKSGTIVQCALRLYGSTSYGGFLLLKLKKQPYWINGKKSLHLILVSLGYYNYGELITQFPYLKKNSKITQPEKGK